MDLTLRTIRGGVAAVWVVSLGLTHAPGLAANGMSAPGYGAAQLGLAGAGTAAAEDRFATLRNPAAGAWLEDGAAFDFGLAVPLGRSKVGPVGAGSNLGLIDIAPNEYRSVGGVFPIPTYARNWRASDRSAFGWGVAASGLKSLTEGGSASLARGLPTFDARCEGSFAGGSPRGGTLDLMGLCGSSDTKLGVDLTQVLVSAHYAYRPIDSLSVGVAPILAGQRIMLRGLGAFAAFSNFPAQTTNNGFDVAYGGGLRLGFLWELADGVGVGGAYQTRIDQTNFDHYKGTIIGGSLDFAPTVNLGLQLHPVDGHRLLFDMERIRYGSVRPLGNRVEAQRFSDECFTPRLPARSADPAPISACLGGPTGPGFGWSDVTVYKFGYQAVAEPLTWRAGFSYGGNPVNGGQTLSKFFAPAITDKHAALGLSWKRANGATLDVALVHAINNRIAEPNAFSNAYLYVLDGALVGYRVDTDPEDQRVESSLQIWELHMSFSWSP